MSDTRHHRKAKRKRIPSMMWMWSKYNRRARKEAGDPLPRDARREPIDEKKP